MVKEREGGGNQTGFELLRAALIPENIFWSLEEKSSSLRYCAATTDSGMRYICVRHMTNKFYKHQWCSLTFPVVFRANFMTFF